MMQAVIFLRTGRIIVDDIKLLGNVHDLWVEGHFFYTYFRFEAVRLELAFTSNFLTERCDYI